MHSGDRNVQRAAYEYNEAFVCVGPIQTASYNVANAPTTALEGKAREGSMRLHRTTAGMARGTVAFQRSVRHPGGVVGCCMTAVGIMLRARCPLQG